MIVAAPTHRRYVLPPEYSGEVRRSGAEVGWGSRPEGSISAKLLEEHATEIRHHHSCDATSPAHGATRHPNGLSTHG